MSTAAPLLQQLGRRVRAARAALGLTRAALAARSGVSARFLSDLEAGRGNISVCRLQSIAQALEVPLGRLLDDEGDVAGTPPAGMRADDAARGRLRAAIDALADADLAAVQEWLHARRGKARTFDKVALIGLRGAGKTSVGARVARRRKMQFIELDRRVELAAGMSLPNLFSIHGEPYYRRLELQVLRDVIGRRGKALIAAGGGIVTHTETFDLLRGSCFTIWLEARPDDHWNRVVLQGDQRPMRGKPQAMAELRAILETRRPLYARAHRSIDTSALGFAGTVEAVLRALDGGA